MTHFPLSPKSYVTETIFQRIIVSVSESFQQNCSDSSSVSSSSCPVNGIVIHIFKKSSSITFFTMLEHIVIGFLLLNGMEISDAAVDNSRDDFECGILIDRTSVTEKNGKWKGQFPWNVECFISNTDHFGGTLIHPSVVLTSGEMIRQSHPDSIIVKAGEWVTESMTNSDVFEIRQVVDIILNEYYTFAGLQIIGLLILEKPYRLCDNINTVCLPQPTALYDGSVCFLSQSQPPNAHYNNPTNPYEPEQLKFEVSNHKACLNYLIKNENSSVWDKNLICANQLQFLDNCRFSRGYALACPIDGDPIRYVQAGIPLFNFNCSRPGKDSIFGNIADVRSWIDKTMDHLKFDKSSYILPSQSCKKEEE